MPAVCGMVSEDRKNMYGLYNRGSRRWQNDEETSD